MDSEFFNAEIIGGVTSNFVASCSATAHPFEYISRIKCPPLDILNFLVTTLKNQDKKFAFI